jgi:hypothetical protein
MISKIDKIRLIFSFIDTFHGYYDVILYQVPIITNQIMVGSGVGANAGSGANSGSRASSISGASSGAGSGTFIFLK